MCVLCVCVGGGGGEREREISHCNLYNELSVCVHFKSQARFESANVLQS